MHGRWIRLPRIGLQRSHTILPISLNLLLPILGRVFKIDFLNSLDCDWRQRSRVLHEISSEVFPLGSAKEAAKKINLASRISFNDIGKSSLQRATSQMSLAHDGGNDLCNAHG